MDATRPRRTRGAARRAWYARQRCLRLARHMGFFFRPPRPAAAHPEPRKAA